MKRTKGCDFLGLVVAGLFLAAGALGFLIAFGGGWAAFFTAFAPSP